MIPGPPFLFGACLVFLSLLTALFLPEATPVKGNVRRETSMSSMSHDGPSNRTISCSSYDSEYDMNDQSSLMRDEII